MITRGGNVIAGLVLIPIGIAIALATESTLGPIVIVGGWTLTVGALAVAVLRPHGVVDGSGRGFASTELMLTLACAAGAAVAASVLAGVAVSWVALVLFTALHWRNIA